MSIGGAPLPQLAAEFGTPLYIYDEVTLRERARRFQTSFASNYPDSSVVYAAKALPSPAIIALLHEEGLGLDVVSGGELYAGLAAGMPPESITFHGNNKGETELREALSAGIGHIAIDNLDEVRLLSRLAVEAGRGGPGPAPPKSGRRCPYPSEDRDRGGGLEVWHSGLDRPCRRRGRRDP